MTADLSHAVSLDNPIDIALKSQFAEGENLSHRLHNAYKQE
jgi:hypothetical protein